VNIDDCAAGPCQNGGACTDGVNKYTCSCAAGFTGPQCQTDIDDCKPNPCENGGRCSDGVNKYTCSCAAGYVGNQCQTDVDDCAAKPCKNGGRCTDQVNAFTCACTTGWFGLVCDSDKNECESNPCQNGAGCEDQVGGFACDCADGYKGTTCETEIDECETTPCLNGGKCTDAIASFSCECPNKWEGATCAECAGKYDRATDCRACGANRHSFPVCELCTVEKDCSGHADTVSVSAQGDSCACVCQAGWEGSDCSIDADECQSGPCFAGTCVDELNGFHCDCDPGFKGDVCQTDVDECSSGPCANGGECVDGINSYRCSCADGFDASADCTACAPGWYGYPTCLECTNAGNCSGNALVVSSNANRTACTCNQCQPGWVGGVCEVDVDECASQPCQNGGVCSDGVGEFLCSCAPGFQGRLCNKAVLTIDDGNRVTGSDTDNDKAAASGAGGGSLFGIIVGVVAGVLILMFVGLIVLKRQRDQARANAARVAGDKDVFVKSHVAQSVGLFSNPLYQGPSDAAAPANGARLDPFGSEDDARWSTAQGMSNPNYDSAETFDISELANFDTIGGPAAATGAQGITNPNYEASNSAEVATYDTIGRLTANAAYGAAGATYEPMSLDGMPHRTANAAYSSSAMESEYASPVYDASPVGAGSYGLLRRQDSTDAYSFENNSTDYASLGRTASTYDHISSGAAARDTSSQSSRVRAYIYGFLTRLVCLTQFFPLTFCINVVAVRHAPPVSTLAGRRRGLGCVSRRRGGE